MTSHSRLFTIICQSLLVLWLAALPLRAQLDPRLQVTNTDFLDLYQRSSTAKVKPEVVTIFDFSGSMDALMYHPLFNNTDASDNEGSGSMSFTLSNSGVAGSDTYTITAKSKENNQVYATVDVTVGAGMSNPYNSGEKSTTNGKLGKSLETYYTSIGDILIQVGATPFATGSTITFSAKVSFRATKGEKSPTPISWTGDPKVNWTISSGSTITSTGTSTATWKVPASISTTPTSPVTASLSGNTVGKLTSIALVKPDGSIVTNADAAAASSTSGQNGASFGANDVRNWVRAASHARFQYKDGENLRTIDIPIPWKVMDGNSTGNPLSSKTVLDSVSRGATTVGSGNAIELDLTYKFKGGDEVLGGGTSQVTTCTLGHVGYKKFYVDWLFLGKYANGSYSSPPKYIVFDAADGSLAGGQGNVNWGKGFGNMSDGDMMMVPVYKLDGITYANKEVSQRASLNVIPPYTRVQAVKRAAITTWIQYQDKVFWAYRFLDDREAGSGTNNSINNNSRSALSTADPATKMTGGEDSGWRLLNSDSVGGMTYIARLFATTCTPLTYATARALAQFSDPQSVFNDVQTGTTNAPSQCMNHFLIIFTDGVDNNSCYGASKSATPYLTTTGTVTAISAQAGNKAIITSKSSIDRTGAYWNLFTFCGVAAHMADPALGTLGTDYLAAPAPFASGTSDTPSTFLPFAISKRGNVEFQKPHLITTMTVGVSLGGSYSDTASPKRSLFLAAAIGDPSMTAWNDLSTLTPFVEVTDPNSLKYGQKQDGSIYFFDATNPEKLVTDLDKAIAETSRPTNTNTTSNPNLPFIGAAYGRQVYLGKFRPPTNGGSIWSGDLMMFGTRQVNDETLIVDKTDNLAKTVDSSTAIWSTATALRDNRLWSARKLFTRIPGTNANPEPGISTFSDTGTAFTDATVGLKNFVATSYATDASKQQVIQFAAGGATNLILDAQGRPTTNRATIMGDIINSSPGVLEYKFDDVKTNLPSTLSGTISTATGITNRFRLLLVGTNQGWLHAFGEVTNVTTIQAPDPNAGQEKVNGSVDELWSFMPTDFLADLNYINVSTNPHRFMVDGTPSIYFLDLPASAGGIGNGVFDIGSDPTKTKERAIAIIGLRKGGRSYYALDIHDPFNPTVKWSLVPDEAAYFPDTRIETGGPDVTVVRSILKNWGYSTCTPGLGRIMFNGILRDVVFLGGGFSTPEVEARFLDSAGDPTPLGRSIIALDVYTGKVLAAVDMTGTTAGPISAGLVPFEFFLNSGMAQRSYFMDYKGGLWSWGKQAVSAVSPYVGYRLDSSSLEEWSVRKVAQDTTGNNAVYSTLPAPFRVGNFQGQGKSGAPSPAVVGIAMMSGDRNNPLDYYYNATTNPAPTQHRLTVVFDRQDHKVWDSTDGAITESSLLNAYESNTSIQAGDPLITPGAETYYLAPHDALGNYSTPKLGYYRYLPPTSGGFIPKGINSPLVVAGALFYSYFSPEVADLCTGGEGTTYANLICDALNPIVADTRKNVSCIGGTQFTWSGVASDFVTIGTQGVLQAGVQQVLNPPPGQSLTTIQLKTILGNRLERFPKVRTWRTIH